MSTVEASDKGTLGHPRAVTEEEVSLAQAEAPIFTDKAVGPDVLPIALIRVGGEMHSSPHLGGAKDGGQKSNSKSLAVWRNVSCQEEETTVEGCFWCLTLQRHTRELSVPRWLINSMT